MNIMYVITHKNIKKKLPYGYRYLQVNTLKNGNFGMDFNDAQSEDNISDKNFSFCELTGLYSIWKTNANLYENVGLSHYRRFFYKPYKIRWSVYKISNLDRMLKKHDIILPFVANMKKNHKKLSIYEHYCQNHYKKDIDTIIEIVKKKYPSYNETLNDFLSNNKICFLNMFYTSKKIIDKYCEWLFPVLFEAERCIDISQYDDYQKRIYGFISERLFNVWVIKNNLRIKYLPVINVETTNIKSRLKDIAKTFLHNKLI